MEISGLTVFPQTIPDRVCLWTVIFLPYLSVPSLPTKIPSSSFYSSIFLSMQAKEAKASSYMGLSSSFLPQQLCDCLSPHSTRPRSLRTTITFHRKHLPLPLSLLYFGLYRQKKRMYHPRRVSIQASYFSNCTTVYLHILSDRLSTSTNIPLIKDRLPTKLNRAASFS